MDWFEIKNWLELSTGLARDSLHVYAGVGVQLFVALIFRRSLASPVPWLFVAFAAFANEFYDYSVVQAPQNREPVYFDEAVSDIWNTLLLPTLFLVIARFWPNWLTGSVAKNRKPDSADGDRPPG